MCFSKIKVKSPDQVKTKKIHSTEGGPDSFLQTVNYGYNIKGAITNINDPDNLGCPFQMIFKIKRPNIGIVYYNRLKNNTSTGSSQVR